MNLLTRLFLSTRATLDDAVSHIENHDAVVEAALKQTRLAVAKAKMQLKAVQKDGKAMRERLTDMQEQAENWERRAKALAEMDEEKALQCLKRRNACHATIQQTEKALENYLPTEEKLRNHVAAMEAKLREVLQQQQQLRARQTTAEAQRVLQAVSATESSSVDAIFERWETKILHDEYAHESMDYAGDPDDMLAHEFDTQESNAALKAELAALNKTDA